MNEQSGVRDSLHAIAGRVAVVGSLNADLTVEAERLPKPGETVHASALEILPGGKSANQAAAAGRLGAEVSIVGAVGDDPNGQLLLDSLKQSGVDVSAVEVLAVPTGTAMIPHDAAGENFILVSPGANGEVDPDMVERHAEAIRKAGVLGLCLEVSLDAVTRSAQIAGEAGTTVVFNDSPFRPDLPADLLAAVDVLIVNEHELEGILAHVGRQATTWEERSEALRSLGVETAVVTLGGRGSVVLEGRTVTEVPPAGPAKPVDTTGAGDAFMGTLMACLASGIALPRAARTASFVAGYSTQSVGAQASCLTREQLLDLPE